MPKVSDTHHEARRAQLLDAARRCFARNGFDGTTVRDIYEEAGLSAGSVYLHFRSKDEIVDALAQDVLARIADESRLLDEADDPIAGLASLVRGFAARTGAASASTLALRVHVWAAVANHPSIARAFHEGFDATRSAVVSALERGKRSGAVAPATDSEATARTVIALLQGLTLQRATGTGVDATSYGEACVAMLERTLRSDR